MCTQQPPSDPANDRSRISSQCAALGLPAGWETRVIPSTPRFSGHPHKHHHSVTLPVPASVHQQNNGQLFCLRSFVITLVATAKHAMCGCYDGGVESVASAVLTYVICCTLPIRPRLGDRQEPTGLTAFPFGVVLCIMWCVGKLKLSRLQLDADHLYTQSLLIYQCQPVLCTQVVPRFSSEDVISPSPRATEGSLILIRHPGRVSPSTYCFGTVRSHAHGPGYAMEPST